MGVPSERSLAVLHRWIYLLDRERGGHVRWAGDEGIGWEYFPLHKMGVSVFKRRQKVSNGAERLRSGPTPREEQFGRPTALRKSLFSGSSHRSLAAVVARQVALAQKTSSWSKPRQSDQDCGHQFLTSPRSQLVT